MAADNDETRTTRRLSLDTCSDGGCEEDGLVGTAVVEPYESLRAIELRAESYIHKLKITKNGPNANNNKQDTSHCFGLVTQSVCDTSRLALQKGRTRNSAHTQ